MEYLPDGRTIEMSHDILRGAIDIHVHPGPHLASSPRRVDPFEAAREARDAGMRAIVIMDVFQMSNGTSWLVNRAIPDFQTYGGLILNTVYGGMNPRAVKTALHYGGGAKFVSFGTHSTYFQAMREGHVIDGTFTPLSELFPKFRDQELPRCIRIPVDDDPTPELDEILRDVAAHPGVFLNTGHVSAEEALRVVELAREYGIQQVLVASTVSKVATLEQLIAMADAGAFIEYTLASYTHTTPIPKTHYYVEKEYVSIDEGMTAAPGGGVKKVAEQIRAIGSERCIIASDFGVYTLSTPVEGLRQFAACMLDLGLPYEDVRTMIKRNPETLLGLGPG